MLYLRDLLPAGKKVKVEYRCDGPVDEYGDTEDMLFDSIEVIKERDNIKNTFCITHNYPLVRIPYTKLNNITIDDLLGDQYLVKGDDFSDTH